MSGGSLPKTGFGVITIGGVAGVGTSTLPLPIAIALAGATAVIVGAILIRLSFRRKRPVGSK